MHMNNCNSYHHKEFERDLYFWSREISNSMYVATKAIKYLLVVSYILVCSFVVP